MHPMAETCPNILKSGLDGNQIMFSPCPDSKLQGTVMPCIVLTMYDHCLQNHHNLIKVDWITKDTAHPGWEHIYRAVDVVQTRVYSGLHSNSNTFGTDLDKSPARRLLWSECRSWLEMKSDFDETLHLECLQHAVPEK